MRKRLDASRPTRPGSAEFESPNRTPAARPMVASALFQYGREVVVGEKRAMFFA